MEFVIRQANEADYLETVLLTREAFWNVYKPGCDEHLVLDKLRKKDDLIKELDLVAECEGSVVGSIIYSKGTLSGSSKNFVTFGPIGVKKDYQRQGAGARMIEASLALAKELGYDAVIITGDPAYYHRFGFETASTYGIHMDGMKKEDEAPFFMVKELKEGVLQGVTGTYSFDPAYFVTPEEVKDFDRNILHVEPLES